MMHSWLHSVAHHPITVFVAFLLVTTYLDNKFAKASIPERTEQQPVLDSSCDAFYMVISTIDGRVSALDLRQHGRLAWSLEADARPLVSSSLAHLELVRNGKKMRLIPALDGAIYQYDGEKVEPIPMSAESLLSSSYQLSDDAMIVGSKSLQNFGLNVKTGEVQFVCNSEGCNTNDSETQDANNRHDTAVVTRITQIIRSVDIKQGQEKWNFSVGEHLLSLPANDAPSQIGNEKPDEELPHIFTGKQDNKCHFKDDGNDENFLRLVVPEGKVVALNRHDSSRVAWEHQFNSPIAKAWLLRNGKLHIMNLFTEQHIPTMSTFTLDDIESDSATQPLLYIGSHQKLLYIQPSPGMEAVLKMYSGRRIGHVFDRNIKVAWRPYLHSASFRTPIFGGNRQDLIHRDKNKKDKDPNSLAVWHEEYPFDTGYFLYPEFRDSRSVKKLAIEDLRKENLENTLINFFWSYRKEILVLIIFTVAISFGVDHFVTKFLFPKKPSALPMHSVSESSSQNSQQSTEAVVAPVESSPSLATSPSGDYLSRFSTDFDCVQCLGKGGFGVVMEVVNKVDDQHYAVKRIKLPRSEEAKVKVLREVKALAKLEHVGIVRYFNAWVEAPPAGWQEEKDFCLGLSDASRQTSFTPTPAVPSFAKLGRKNKKKSSVILSSHQENDDSHDNLRLEADLNTDTESIVFASEESAKDLPGLREGGGGSGEFTVHSDLSESKSSWDESSYSLLKISEKGRLDLTLSSNEDSCSHSQSSVPFSNYSQSTSRHSPVRDNDLSADSVVFDDSKPHIHDHSDNLAPSDNTDFQISIPSSCCEATKDKTDLTSEKKGGELQGAKYFLYIQMQLYRKETLKEWLHNNTLNRNRVELMDIFDQILCAVNYVHSCGLMHRDLKPSNIFFTEEGVVKVGDFGLATPLSVQEAADKASNPNGLPSSGHTADVGTSLYMSPEQLARKPYNLKVDVFSMGLIFLELCMPFSTIMERVRTLQDARNHVLPSRFERELPTECELVRTMTSEDPSHRPTVKEILDHSLLTDLAPTRLDQRQRTRTISNNSNE